MAKGKVPKPPRWIDTRDMPEKYDCADLIATGISTDELKRWIQPRLRAGCPVVGDIEEDKPKPKPKEPGEVVQLRKPLTQVVAKERPLPEMDEDSGEMPPEFSETVIADQFVAAHRNDIAFIPEEKAWRVWCGDRWTADAGELNAREKAKQFLSGVSGTVMTRLDLGNKRERIATQLASYARVASTVRLAELNGDIWVDAKEFDGNDNILGTPKGTVDLDTGELREARSTDYITRLTSTSPEHIKPERWLQFLEECTNGDPELQLYLQRIAGYCLTGSTTAHKFFFCYGSGGNGKGVYLNTLARIMGDYAENPSSSAFMAGRFQQHPEQIAKLRGCRLAVSQELEAGARWDEPLIKSMTGGDTISSRFMYGSTFEFKPKFTLIFSGNHKPQIRSVDDAIRRRMFLIPFDYTVPEGKIDGSLGDYLVDVEGGGILSWAIEGYQEWRKHGLAAPDRVKQITGEYLDSEDNFSSFLSDSCNINPHARETVRCLYKAYQEWCETCGMRPLMMKRFVEEMSKKGHMPRMLSGSRVFTGFQLKPIDKRLM